MICKLSKGKGTNRGFRGLFEYLQHGPRGEKLNRGHVLATNLAGTSPREWSKEIAAFRQLRPSLGKAVFHASLSLAPQDRQLSDAEFAGLASRFLAGMGFEDSPFLVVRHHDTPSHQHVHVVASRIDCRGNVVSDSGDYRKAEQLMRTLEAEFRLRRLAPSHDNNNSKGAGMDGKRSTNTAGPAEEQDQIEAAAACVDESGEPVGAKRGRDYKRRLLEESYQQQVSDLLAAELAYVRKGRHSLELTFRGGGKVYDDGDRVRAFGDDDEASARRVVQLCKAKAWGAVKFQGNDAFLRAAMREAIAAGLKVVPADDHQAELLQEAIREQAGQAVGHCERVPDIPPLAVHGLKSRLGAFRQERDGSQPAPTDTHRGPRMKF